MCLYSGCMICVYVHGICVYVSVCSVCTWYVYDVCIVFCASYMCGWCVDDVYGICVCMMYVYTFQGTHAKFRKRTSWFQFSPSMWVLEIELGFLGKGFTCRAAFLRPSLCKDSELCPDEGIASFLIFFLSFW